MFLENSIFGSFHIIVLVLCIALIVAASIFLRNIKFNTAVNIMLVIGVISESIKVFYYIVANESTLNGYLPKTDLPFHLCSIQIIFFAVLKLFKSEKVKNVLVSFMIPTCLIGGAGALFLPTHSARNAMIVTVQYFMYHSGIIWFAIYNLVSKDFKLTIDGYVSTLIFLFITLFVAIYLNSWIYDGRVDANGVATNSINFMYVVGPPVDGLPFLNKDHGWLVYILRYSLLAVTAVTICYIKPIINFFKSLKNKKDDKSEEIA